MSESENVINLEQRKKDRFREALERTGSVSDAVLISNGRCVDCAESKRRCRC